MAEAYEFQAKDHTFYINSDRTGTISGGGKTRKCILMGILAEKDLGSLKIGLGLDGDIEAKAKTARSYLKGKDVALATGASYAVWAEQDGKLKALSLPAGTLIQTHQVKDEAKITEASALESLADGQTLK